MANHVVTTGGRHGIIKLPGMEGKEPMLVERRAFTTIDFDFDFDFDF